MSLIVGVSGACRKSELINIEIKDIEETQDCVKITIPVTKTKKPRVFVITEGGFEGVDILAIFKKYSALRPIHCNEKTTRFFIQYRSGKCVSQPIGINTMAVYPERVATFLKLPEPKLFTSHSFRRSSASLLANTGVETAVLKRFGGWASEKTVEGYVDQSLNNKKEIAGKIFGKKLDNGHSTRIVNPLPSTSAAQETNSIQPIDCGFNNSDERNDNAAPIPAQANVSALDQHSLSNINIPCPSFSGSSFPIQLNNLNNCTINIIQK